MYTSSRNLRQRARPLPTRPVGRSRGLRLIIALALAACAIISFFSSKVFNPITGEDQYLNITEEQEIALGLQAAPEMARQYGGLDPDPRAQGLVDAVGQRLVAKSVASQSDYPFEFHLLADPETINAFALPGGQVFITDGLLTRLQSEGQLAGVLAHEIVHVLARHGAQRIAQQELTQGLTGAVVLATYDPNDPRSQTTAQIAMLIGGLVNMKYGREDELQSDSLGVRVMSEAGYDPGAMLGVMQILDEATTGARPPEFFSTHPNPENRLQRIQEAIQQYFPDGVPAGLTP